MASFLPAPDARPAILVADDDEKYRTAIARALCQMGYSAAATDGSAKTVSTLRRHPFAAVIATVRMPTLRGAAMLQELARWPAATAVLAVGDPGTSVQVLSALRGRPSAFLANPFARTSLERELRQLLSDTSIDSGQAPSPGALDLSGIVREIASGDAQVPAIAPIAADVQRLLRDPEAGVGEVLEVVGQDPAVATNILRLANSSRYRPPSPIRTLRTACMRLGNQRVLALAQEAVLRDLFAVGAGPVQQIVSALWRHTQIKAYGAREIAVRAGVPRPDELQVAAMMVDLGELALLRVFAERQPRTASWREEAFLAQVGAGIANAHEEVSAELLRRWQLDSWIVDLARHHHSSPRHGGRRVDARARAVLVVAWAGACRAGFGWLPGQEEADPGRSLTVLGLDEDALTEVFADASDWVEDD